MAYPREGRAQGWLKELGSPFAPNVRNSGMLDCDWEPAREWILTLNKDILLPVFKDKDSSWLDPEEAQPEEEEEEDAANVPL